MTSPSIKTLEDNLFARWRMELPLIIQDGVFDEIAYGKATPKILFILKEPHSSDKDACFDLREVVGNGGIYHTWSNIARWAKALRLASSQEPDQISYQEFENVDQNFIQAELKNVSVMNLKKRVGKSSTSMAELKTYIAKQTDYDTFFIEQYRLYDPDIVIACGSEVAETFRRMLSIEDNWTATRRGLWYFQTKSTHLEKQSTPVLSWVHPQLRGSMRWPLATFPIIDAWAELSVSQGK